MTSRILARVARRTCHSRLGERAVIWVDGIACPTSATWIRAEEDDDDAAGRRTVARQRIRFPVADMHAQPVAGDTVEIGGKTLYVVACLERGGAYRATLSLRRPD